MREIFYLAIIVLAISGIGVSLWFHLTRRNDGEIMLLLICQVFAVLLMVVAVLLTGRYHQAVDCSKTSTPPAHQSRVL